MPGGGGRTIAVAYIFRQLLLLLHPRAHKQAVNRSSYNRECESPSSFTSNTPAQPLTLTFDGAASYSD